MANSRAVNGAPANFAQHAPAGAGGITNAHGAAPEFHYEVASGDVSMSGGAFIAYQDTEFRCSLIIYNLTSQKYRGIAARDKGEVCRGQTHAGNPPAPETRPPSAGGNAP
jgi:lipopolysaccharide export system protein LptA